MFEFYEIAEALGKSCIGILNLEEVRILAENLSIQLHTKIVDNFVLVVLRKFNRN